MRPSYFIWLVFVCNTLLAQSLSRDTTLARQYLDKGNSYLTDNTNLDSSAFYFEKAASIYSQHDLPENLYDAQNKVGETLRKKGKLQKSEEFTLTIIKQAEEKIGGENLILAASYNNLGDIYSSRGEYEQAQQYFKKALQIRDLYL